MTTQKHQSGTPRLVQYLRNFGALPSSANPYRLRTAQYVYVFPAEKMEVNIRLRRLSVSTNLSSRKWTQSGEDIRVDDVRENLNVEMHHRNNVW